MTKKIKLNTDRQTDRQRDTQTDLGIIAAICHWRTSEVTTTTDCIA